MTPIEICKHLGPTHIDAYYDELSGKEVRAVLKAGGSHTGVPATAYTRAARRVADAPPPGHAQGLPRLPRGQAQPGRDRRRLLRDEPAREAARGRAVAHGQVPQAPRRDVSLARRPPAGDARLRSHARAP